jgi:hypothetical protein
VTLAGLSRRGSGTKPAVYCAKGPDRFSLSEPADLVWLSRIRPEFALGTGALRFEARKWRFRPDPRILRGKVRNSGRTPRARARTKRLAEGLIAALIVRSGAHRSVDRGDA